MILAGWCLFTENLSFCILTAYMLLAILLIMAPPRKRVKVQRLEIHLDPPLLAWLRLEAVRLDVSLSELLRCLIRKEMGL